MAGPQTYSGNGHTVVIADPENITRDECIALAKCGAAEWNKWREAFPGEPVPGHNTARFDGCDFVREHISFEGFRFGRADFSRARFPRHQNFWRCSFGKLTSFEGACFEGAVRFNGSQFGIVDFSRASFLDWADFAACDFDGSAHFKACEFKDITVFRSAFLRVDAKFDFSRFASNAYFSGALFGSDASFVCCEFAGCSEFSARDWSDLRHDFQEPNRTLEDAQVLAEKLSMSPTWMGDIDFSGASFKGPVNFSGRGFRARACFDTGRRPTRSWTETIDGEESCFTEYVLEPTRFSEPPQFFDCEINQQLTFNDTVFPLPTGDTTASRAYRTLKLAFSKQQATREEQRFFKLEMQEEAVSESGWKRWLYRVYEFTSDYGFSVWRPIATLILLPALVAMLLYLMCMGLNHPKLMISALVDDSQLTSAWIQFTFANMAPLPDGGVLRGLRTVLFGSNTYAAAIALTLETLQKVLALAGYFLFGLALRNLFKMK